jgi:hypothetical protein
VGVGLGIECIAGMIDVFFNFRGNQLPSKGFKCAECEKLLDNDKLSMNQHATQSYIPYHGMRMG